MVSQETLRRSWRSWFSEDMQHVRPRWLQYVWTLVFCLIVALGLTVVGFLTFVDDAGAWRKLPGWWHWYQINVVISLCVGFAIHFLFDASQRVIGAQRIRRLRPWQKRLFFTTIPITGVAIGWPLGVLWALGVDVGRWFSLARPRLLVGGVLLLLLIFLLNHLFAIKARQLAAEARAAEAQLKLLQAQIEPHFLFNTLANVVSLIESDAARARQMLEAFIAYLRSSLTTLRGEDATLGQELDVAEAYLELLQMRMAERLHYRIDVAEAERERRLPALLLQPLVENAIVHGLEPKLEGGSVVVRATRAGATLSLVVEDDGLGLRAPNRAGAGAGVALDNIRQRLAARYGNAASLRVEDGHPGVRATITLPDLAS